MQAAYFVLTSPITFRIGLFVVADNDNFRNPYKKKFINLIPITQVATAPTSGIK